MDIVTDFREWIIAGSVLFVSFLAAPAVREVLRKIGERKNFPYLTALAPTMAWLITILGLRIFGEIAPLSPKLTIWLEGTVYVLAVLIFLQIVRRSALIAVEWGLSRSHNSATLQLGFVPVLRNLITLFIFFMGAIMILKYFNYDVFSLLTALGVGSLAVGLAAKDTLSNMISGFMIILDRNLRPGDRVSISGLIGDVDEIGLRSTRIRTGDGNTLIVPNSDLVNSKIVNLSMPSRRGTCSVSFRIPYSFAFDRVKVLCLSTFNEIEKADRSSAPWINISNVLDGGQQIDVGFWLPEMDWAGDAKTEFLRRLEAKLSAEGGGFVGPISLTSPRSP